MGDFYAYVLEGVRLHISLYVIIIWECVKCEELLFVGVYMVCIKEMGRTPLLFPQNSENRSVKSYGPETNTNFMLKTFYRFILFYCSYAYYTISMHIVYIIFFYMYVHILFYLFSHSDIFLSLYL